ncbi:acetyl-CoA synthetase [Acuticoccus sediminis]|uniref:Acetyl-CoA synthetase n=1 Tax=Acuticoccus sediminis TaxID=2184697 RepID=A0A8B2NF77_9HYPH|nr:class I adenylate-forming enzyme family protein [Acuticoccus sediminis]RAH97428.1 acetyl-CoA synthetase [Acuticoccus sediminis]
MTTNLGMISCEAGAPDKPAFIGSWPDGTERVMTYAALNRMADAFARGLVAHGVARGERIGILSANRPDYVAAILGAMRAGVVPVPINFKFPPATIAYIVADSAVRVLVCDEPRRASAPATDAVVLTFEGEGDGTFASWLDEGPFDAVDPAADDPALILYTSGSTGRPKGVLLSHASHLWVAHVRVPEYRLNDERVLIAAPLYHMNALALSFLVCASGSTAILLPQFQAAHYIEAITRYRCTWLTAVPPMIAMMLREKEALAAADLSSVHSIRMGSAPVNEALAQTTAALLPNAHVINAYGTTEGGPIGFGAHPDGRPTPSGSVGYPHPEVEVRLVGENAPERGTLQLRSPGQMLGYLNRPDVASPVTADGFYDTGDVFRRDGDGFYYFVGRVDDMFVSGGENIYPSEVEHVIEEAPGVAQACVVPVNDDIKGTKPVAFVIRKAGSDVTEDEIKAFVLANAPAYQHPRRVWFVDRLPLTTTNKIDRNALMARATEAMAEPEGAGSS